MDRPRTAQDYLLALLALVAALGAVLVILKRKNSTTMDTPTPTLPVEGRVTSPFGPRRAPTAGASTRHNGVDLSAPVGTPVRAPWDGTVAATYYNTTGGNQMLVDHPGGYRTGYAHLSKFVAAKGQSVRQGDIIALTGNTGIGTGSHLHFTLTDPQGNKVDPQSIFTFNA